MEMEGTSSQGHKPDTKTGGSSGFWVPQARLGPGVMEVELDGLAPCCMCHSPPVDLLMGNWSPGITLDKPLAACQGLECETHAGEDAHTGSLTEGCGEGDSALRVYQHCTGEISPEYPGSWEAVSMLSWGCSDTLPPLAPSRGPVDTLCTGTCHFGTHKMTRFPLGFRPSLSPASLQAVQSNAQFQLPSPGQPLSGLCPFS